MPSFKLRGCHAAGWCIIFNVGRVQCSSSSSIRPAKALSWCLLGLSPCSTHLFPEILPGCTLFYRRISVCGDACKFYALTTLTLLSVRQAWDFSMNSQISANFVCPGTFLRSVQIWEERKKAKLGEGLGWFLAPNLVKFSASYRHWSSSIRSLLAEDFGICCQSTHCSVLVTSSNRWKWRSELSVKWQLPANVCFLKTVLVV